MPDPALRRPFRLDMQYRLCRPGGWKTPTTQSKTWFFEIPEARATPEAWTELLHRIIYDANVVMKRREPNDEAWLGFDSFVATPVEPRSILPWDGKSADLFPWMAAEQKRVWEPGACYIVDDVGRYDLLGAHDFTELLMLRLLNSGAVTPQAFVEFFNRYFLKGEPGAGKRMYDDREKRFANLTVIREVPGVFRRAPGSTPVVSGPVDPGA